MLRSSLSRQEWRLVASPFPGLCRTMPTLLRQTSEPATVDEFRESQLQCPALSTPIFIDQQQYFVFLERLIVSARTTVGDVRIFMERRDAAMDAQFPKIFFDERVVMGIWITDAFRRACINQKKVLMFQDTIRRDLAEPGSNRLMLTGSGIDARLLDIIVATCNFLNPDCLQVRNLKIPAKS
jgi:hypothetical protein